MAFNPKKAAIFLTVKREKVFKWARPLKLLFFFLFAFLFFAFVLGFDTLGLSFISFSLSWLFLLLETFFKSKLKNPGTERENLATFLDFELAKSVIGARKIAKAKRAKEADSSFLYYSILEEKEKETAFIFSRAVLDTEELKGRVEQELKTQEKGKFEGFSKDFEETLIEAFKIAKEKGKERIGLGDAIVALARKEGNFQKLLIDFDLRAEDFENLVFWWESVAEKIAEKKKFWSKKNLKNLGSLGKEFASGFTVLLDNFSVDMANTLRGFTQVVGHKEVFERLERILTRQQTNNILLVGEPGTGRKTILQVLSQRCLYGQCSSSLNYKRVVLLDLPSLISRTGRGFESTLERIFLEIIKAGNVILVIDEFQNYVGGERRPGTVDITGILMKYLRHPDFRLIAVTTPQGLHHKVERAPDLLSLFEQVEVTEISLEESVLVLENFVPALEMRYKKFVSYPALREIISLSDRYLPSFAFPKKAIDVLEEAMVYLSTSTTENFLMPRHIAKVISEKARIPIGELEKSEKEMLLNLEDLMHQRIINQEEAVVDVATAMRRARAEITLRKKPIGVFLFLGPTGVGKTETSKALAEIYFGSEDNMIRLDMSEFQLVDDIPRLIGSLEQEGLLTTPIRERPFSLLLLDEIEKAHSNVLNLFLQVFDEGHVTDGLGRKVSFKNSLIIATSNAGYKIILRALKENRDWEGVKQEMIDYLFEEGVFRPEFVNRFDAVVVFKPLTKENLLDIAGLMLNKMKKSLKLKHIDFEITESLKEKIVELGYNPVFGAREMNRVIQDNVENALARALLAGTIGRGDKIKMDGDFRVLKVGES